MSNASEYLKEVRIINRMAMKQEFQEYGCDRTTISHVPASERVDKTKARPTLHDRYSRLHRAIPLHHEHTVNYTPCAKCRVSTYKYELVDMRGALFCRKCV